MSKEPGLLPKVEILIFGVCFLAFLLWAVSKCNSTSRKFQEEAAREAAEAAMLDSLDRAALSKMEPLDTSIKPLEKPIPESQLSKYPPLYVTIKGLNVRSGPGLNYKKTGRLQLYDKVYFLGEMSDSLETIDLGDITTTEPWVKIVDKSGKKGWVYGAGVDYYKHELKGVHTD
jgi:uncharacterized protein YgiM (DUF1202 family)